MAGSNILREFLIKLGFDVDLQKFKAFQDKEKSVIETLTTMGKVGAATGIAVAAAVLKIANDMEQLYFSSERAGTSVQSLMALRFGGAQAGIGADAMASAVEQMASTIRSNPGLVAFFKRMGLPVLKDNAKNFTNMIGALRDLDARGGGVMARMIGAQFGFDEQTLTLLFRNYPDFLRGLKEQDDLLAIAGINADKFGKDSHEAMENWRVLVIHLKALGYVMAEDLLPAIDKFVVFLTKALELVFGIHKAFKPVIDTVVGVTGAVIGGATSIISGAEGFRSNVYKDIAGNPTIGYGHKLLPGETFAGGVTQQGAAALLAQDTAAARDAVLRMVKVALTSNQLSALTDLVYNVGPGALAGSTLLKNLNAGNYAGAADEFVKFNHAMVGGQLQTVDALTSRRLADRDLFNKPDVSMNQTTNIHIDGVSDPNEAGKVVASQQTRINGDLIRNLSGAVQ
jgi:lysozyme